MNGFLSGYWLSISIIFAIGSQNAFVIRQGLKKEFVPLVVAICALSDIILITVGVTGFSYIIKSLPELDTWIRYGGAVFLLAYGLRSFWEAYKLSKGMSLPNQKSESMLRVALTCMAFTWLNPHVYLDTVVLIGMISAQYPLEKIQFYIGACLASISFFMMLGFGAKKLAPILQTAKAWKILEFSTGFIMCALAYHLLVQDLSVV